MHNEERGESVVAQRLRSLLRWIGLAEALIGGAALLVIFVLVLIQAIQRYLPQGGWPWTAELATYCLVWLTFGMLGYLTGRDGHITLQLFDSIKSRTFQRGLRLLADLCVLAVAIGFAVAGFHLVSDETSQVSPALRMPLVFLYVVPLAGFVLTAIRAAVAIFLPGLEVPRDERTPAEATDQGVV